MDFVGYLFTFALGVFTGSLATSWANVIFSHHDQQEYEERQKQDRDDRFDRHF